MLLLPLALHVAARLPLCEAPEDCEGEGETEGEPVPEAEREGDAEARGLRVPVLEPLRAFEVEAAAVGLTVTRGDTESEVVGDCEREAAGEAVSASSETLGCGEAEGSFEVDAVAL